MSTAQWILVLSGGVAAGLFSFIVALVGRKTAREANENAQKKMAADLDEQDRKAAAEWRSELRAELKRAEEKGDHLQGEVDRLRTERNDAREELALRRFACSRIGNPCQAAEVIEAVRRANETTDNRDRPDSFPRERKEAEG